MLEVFVYVNRRKTLPLVMLTSFTAALTLVSFFMALLISPMILATVIFAGCTYFLFLYTNVEYEYSYFDGEARFTKILNKSRRKGLKHYSMDEVILIAPAGNRGLYSYENDSKVKVKDYTSGHKGMPYYEMVVRDNDLGKVLIKFEPDQKYLDAVCMKYASKVVRE